MSAFGTAVQMSVHKIYRGIAEKIYMPPKTKNGRVPFENLLSDGENDRLRIELLLSLSAFQRFQKLFRDVPKTIPRKISAIKTEGST